MKYKLFRKADIIIILVVAVVAGLLLLVRNIGDETPVAKITVDGEIVETINLSEITDRVEFRPETDPYVLIVAQDGKIWFEDAGCNDKICVSSGKLYRKGDTAVCLPAKTVVSISGSSVDAVTY